MSDSIKRFVGIFLIIIAVTVCFIARIIEKTDTNQTYQSGYRQKWALQPVTPETEGSLRINFADKDELQSLPGIGEVLSSMILAERDKNGVFYYAEDLEAVKGIGPRTLERFREMIDLSTEESE